MGLVYGQLALKVPQALADGQKEAAIQKVEDQAEDQAEGGPSPEEEPNPEEDQEAEERTTRASWG